MNQVRKLWGKSLAASLLWLLALSAQAAHPDSQPLSNSSRWQMLSYSSIPANSVDISGNTMQISVQGSASPIIYPLHEPTHIKEIHLDLTVDGEINLQSKKQGDSGADDFLFRLGLVYEGEKTLNFLERTIAPEWIKKLHGLAKGAKGIDYISFHNVYSDNQLAGQQRQHPNSDLLQENFFAAAPGAGKTVSLKITPEPGKRVLALWISCDGDDTSSFYNVRLDNLTVVPAQ